MWDVDQPKISDFAGLYGVHDWYGVKGETPLCTACAYNRYQICLLESRLVLKIRSYDVTDVYPERDVICTDCGLIIVMVGDGTERY